MKLKKMLEKIRNNPVYIKAAFLFILSVILFICVYIWDNSRTLKTGRNGQKVLERSENAGEKEKQELKVKAGGTEESVNITVSGKAYSTEELREKFEKAADELEKIILGENDSLDDVRRDLNLVNEILDTGITVSWELDNYDVMDIRGKIRQEKLVQDGTLIRLTAVLMYEDEKAYREFYARILPPHMSRSEKLISKINEYVLQSDEDTKTEDYLPLPDKVDGVEIEWEYPVSTRAFAILILGAGGACMVCVSDRQRKKEEEKRKKYQMKTDYPQIINKFNLYLGAGMTVRRAWFCIVRDYEKKKSKTGKRQAYEEMIYTMHQIQSGAAEGEAYEKFGSRCGISIYRKFGTLLSQNLRKGSKGLSAMLGREAEEAFEERVNRAKKSGEEAGTKLMIPMFMMLSIVFVIVIVPAFFSIQI